MEAFLREAFLQEQPPMPQSLPGLRSTGVAGNELILYPQEQPPASQSRPGLRNTGAVGNELILYPHRQVPLVVPQELLTAVPELSSPLLRLLPELLRNIFSHVDDSIDQVCLALTCRRLLQISSTIVISIPSVASHRYFGPPFCLRMHTLMTRLAPLDLYGRPLSDLGHGLGLALCCRCLQYRPKWKSFWGKWGEEYARMNPGKDIRAIWNSFAANWVKKYARWHQCPECWVKEIKEARERAGRVEPSEPSRSPDRQAEEPVEETWPQEPICLPDRPTEESIGETRTHEAICLPDRTAEEPAAESLPRESPRLPTPPAEEPADKPQLRETHGLPARPASKFDVETQPRKPLTLEMRYPPREPLPNRPPEPLPKKPPVPLEWIFEARL